MSQAMESGTSRDDYKRAYADSDYEKGWNDAIDQIWTRVVEPLIDVLEYRTLERDNAIERAASSRTQNTMEDS